MPQKSTLAAAAVALAIAAVPAAAQAASVKVYAGSPKPLKGAPQSGDANEFFPSAIKVKLGTRVAFQFRGFHSVYFPKKGGSPPELIQVQPQTPVSGFKDAANNDFWFNGKLPRAVFNNEAALPTGKTKVNGKDAVGSGIPQGDKPLPFNVTFAKAGTYRYFCTVHPFMSGKISVAKKGKKGDSKSKIASRIAKQFAKAVAELKKLGKFVPADPATMQAGNDNKRVSLLQFFPKTLSVTVGTPVTLTMQSSPTNEIHTFSFGPLSYLTPIADGFVIPEPSPYGPPTLVFNPLIAYPSDPPTGAPTTYSATAHGNGFWNSGVLDSDLKSPQPQAARITFPAAGTYHLICLIHGPNMAADITVTS